MTAKIPVVPAAADGFDTDAQPAASKPRNPLLPMIRVYRPAWHGALTGGLAIVLGLALVPVKAAESSMASDAKSDMHHSERVMSDTWVTTKVKSELLAKSISDGTNVSVKTTHGIVVLTGKLASQDAVNDAKRIAERVKGVKRVDSSGLTIGSR
ncbi:transporter [Pandoraea anapnoica]|uniref:Transporter n=1 Tax=Pandoraea anapnoica TaxID=2508301 RepID=A0A5E4ZWH6_9BURK|nr:BON domain-containing protein [Pandoraea anapnoica]VVE65356.1 transporter [Pandoraea anapnoica]